jgi:carboxypeptidase family protein
MRLAVAIVLGAATLAAQQAPPRDATRPVPAGTGSISGIIETDDAQHKPLRRAKVMLNTADRSFGRTIVTNDDGTFAFDGLPAGRYTLAAQKPGYPMMAYGARRSGRQGIGVPLAAGESKRLALRLPRGAVITGTIVDSDGQPAAGVQVTVGAYRWTGTSPVIVTSAEPVRTDDRGVYRAFGLPPGDYLVAAQARLPDLPTGFTATSTVDVVSDAEIRRALAEPRGSVRSATPDQASSTAPPPPPRRALSLVPVYYPGVTSEARATTVSVAAGEERAGIDLQLQYVPSTTVRVMMTAAAADARVFLQTSGQPTSGIVKNAVADADGRFTFTNVFPGSYRVVARVPIQSGPVSSVPQALWAYSEVVVNGEDLLDVALTPQPALTISGRLVFDGSRPPLAALPGVTVALPARNSVFGSVMPVLPPARIEPGSRFTISEVPPGPYRFDTGVPGLRTAIGGWWLQSISIGGRDILDGELELRQSEDGAVITFTDRATELAGRLTDAKGNPAGDATVVIFATDANAWFLNSRRVAAVRAGPDGRYAIANLPAADYFVAASDDVDSGEWYDPALLRRLARSAGRVTLGRFEKKTQDLVVDRQ